MAEGLARGRVIEPGLALKGSDARERRFRSSRFAVYKVALFLQDVASAFLAFWGGLWAGGVAVEAGSRLTQYGFLFILALLVVGFFPTFHLYKYRYIFMTKTHLVKLLTSLFWGFLSVGIIAFVYRTPHLLKAPEVFVLTGALGLGLLFLSRFYLAQLLHLVKAIGMGFVALGILGLISRDEIPLIAYEGAVFLWSAALSVFLIAAGRFFTVHVLFSNWLRRNFRRQVAIMGSDEEGGRIAELIVSKKAPFWVAGFIGPQEEGGVELPMAKGRLGELKDLPSLVQKESLDDIIVTDERVEKKTLISLLDYCTSEGLSVWFSPRLMPIIDMKVYIDNFCGIPMIRLCSQKHDWVFNRLKHALDSLLTLPGLVILLPLFGAIAAAIKITSPGPVFYRAKVIGKNGKPFTMYKFRSMVVNGGSEIHKQYVTRLIKGEIRPDTEGGLPLKVTNDPRVTKVGRVLRKTSLDELPQLLNVLKGEMSLVGPRPCLPYEFEIYKDWHKKRLSVRPGITGLWQVTGRSEVAFEDMVLLDLYYLYNRSFSMDMSIVYETVFALLGKRGAY